MRDKAIALHFIGAGGVGVNALAKFALACGVKVSASDRSGSAALDALAAAGAQVWTGSCPDRMAGAGAVIYSSAVGAEDAELSRALREGIPVYERHVALGAVSRMFSRSVGIAGTHGKTTTTAMLTHILDCAGVREVAMIGGMAGRYSNYHCNFPIGAERAAQGGIYDATFVTEACEYRRSFLSLSPTVGLVTNMECDHPDCYRDISEAEEAFGRYLANSKARILPASLGAIIGARGVREEDGAHAILVEREGVRRLVRVVISAGACTLESDGKALCRIALREGGDYDLLNAAYATIAAAELGVDAGAAADSLGTFEGVSRRYERAGELCGVPVYFDFAHHPTEIGCVLRRASAEGKVFVVFQPHTFSRTKAYFDDFVRVLTSDLVGELVLMPAYSARERESDGVGSEALLEGVRGKGKREAVLLPASEVVSYVKRHAAGQGVILFVGAGDIYALKRDIS